MNHKEKKKVAITSSNLGIFFTKFLLMLGIKPTGEMLGIQVEEMFKKIW